MLDRGKCDTSLGGFIPNGALEERERVIAIPSHGVTFDRDNQLGFESSLAYLFDQVIDVGLLVISCCTKPIHQLLLEVGVSIPLGGQASRRRNLGRGGRCTAEREQGENCQVKLSGHHDFQPMG